MVDQEQLVDEIKLLSDSIRRKHRALRLGVSEREKFLESTFQPVVGPLTEISKKLDNNIMDTSEYDKTGINPETDVETFEEMTDKSAASPSQTHREASNLSLLGEDIASKGVRARKYLLQMLHSAPAKSTYHVYGARMTDGGIKIGNSAVDVDNDDNLLVGDKTYEGTKGLFELVFKQVPTKYTAKDLKVFKKILQDTNAHKKNYLSNSPIYRNKSNKYSKIISTLFPPKYTKKKSVSGEGLKNTQETNVIYYNDINKLVDRLRLLYDAVNAGHTGLDNEIVALTEELRNRNFIE